MDPNQLHCIFQKSLSNTDITERLAFPVHLIGYIGGPKDARQKDFHVVDRLGNGWEFRVHMRWDQSGHLKPEVYGSEWKRFVKANNLKRGDQLFFYRHPDPAPAHVTFVISIKRSITLFGNTFSGHIATA